MQSSYSRNIIIKQTQSSVLVATFPAAVVVLMSEWSKQQTQRANLGQRPRCMVFGIWYLLLSLPHNVIWLGFSRLVGFPPANLANVTNNGCCLLCAILVSLFIYFQPLSLLLHFPIHPQCMLKVYRSVCFFTEILFKIQIGWKIKLVLKQS